MPIAEVAVAALLVGGTIVFASGHKGGRLFNWLISHPATHKREPRAMIDPARRHHDHRLL